MGASACHLRRPRRKRSGRAGRPAGTRSYTEFPYATRTSWSCERRVIAKAEHLADKANPRFVVTSLPADTFSARTVYERLYCQRGNAENAIKEQQLDLFSDRTSATCFAANQLRLLFSAFVSVLFAVLRQALHGTRLARATAGTLRLKLIRIGARVMVSVRRVKVAMDSAHPSASAFARVHARITGQPARQAAPDRLRPTPHGTRAPRDPSERPSRTGSPVRSYEHSRRRPVFRTSPRLTPLRRLQPRLTTPSAVLRLPV